MTLRAAEYEDLDVASGIFADAFWHESVFGELIHPKRAQYPQDYRRYWRQRVSEWYWDPRHQLVVSYVVKSALNSREEEILTGVADWMRLGKLSARHGETCANRFGRNIVRAFVVLRNRIASFFWPNRAADPAMSNLGQTVSSLIAHHWYGSRSTGWYLNFLAVKPAHQGQGYGSDLVAWGIERAQQEKVPASVISGERKDGFYKRCGFDIEVGNSTEGEGNPLRDRTGGGTILFREPAS